MGLASTHKTFADNYIVPVANMPKRIIGRHLTVVLTRAQAQRFLDGEALLYQEEYGNMVAFVVDDVLAQQVEADYEMPPATKLQLRGNEYISGGWTLRTDTNGVTF